MSDLSASEPRGGLDVPPRTQPLPPEAAPAMPPPAAPSSAERAHERERTAEELLRNPIAAMREPENRSRLWLATALLTLLNTLLLLGVLVAVSGDKGPEPVVVDGQPCLVVEGEKAGTLFCQR